MKELLTKIFYTNIGTPNITPFYIVLLIYIILTAPAYARWIERISK